MRAGTASCLPAGAQAGGWMEGRELSCRHGLARPRPKSRGYPLVRDGLRDLGRHTDKPVVLPMPRGAPSGTLPSSRPSCAVVSARLGGSTRSPPHTGKWHLTRRARIVGGDLQLGWPRWPSTAARRRDGARAWHRRRRWFARTIGRGKREKGEREKEKAIVGLNMRAAPHASFGRGGEETSDLSWARTAL